MCNSVVEHFPVVCVALDLCLRIGGEKDIGGSVKRYMKQMIQELNVNDCTEFKACFLDLR